MYSMDEKPTDVEQVKSPEVIEAEDRARSFMGAFVGDLAYDLSEGLYVRDKHYNAPEEPSGDLKLRSVLDFVEIFQEIGLDKFSVEISPEGSPTLTFTDPRGRCFRAAYQRTQYSGMRETHHYLAVSETPDAEPSIFLHRSGVLAHTSDYSDEAHIVFMSKIGGRERDITFTYDEDANKNPVERIVSKVDKLWNGDY